MENDTKLSWLRIENEDYLSAISGFISNLKKPVNAMSNVKQDKNGKPYIFLGFQSEDGFEGNTAAVWFPDFDLAQDGRAMIEKELGL